MGGSKRSSNAPRLRKRVEAESSEEPPQSSTPSLKRAKDGSAFVKCDECQKDVPVALITFHNCVLDAKIRTSLEAQVVDMPSEPKKTSEKRKPRSAEPKAKKSKNANNQNTRKRPPTAFFVFMEDFRKTFKEANPDCKSVAQVAKEGGEKWKSMSEEEKKVYLDRAADLKAEYEKALESDNVEDDQDVIVIDEKDADDEDVIVEKDAKDVDDDEDHVDAKDEHVDGEKIGDVDAETTVKKENEGDVDNDEKKTEDVDAETKVKKENEGDDE